MSDFKKFATQVRTQFEMMSKHELYTLKLEDSEEVWNVYLDSFPAGTNEIFRERRHYDGSYDRNVIRQIGHLAAIIDNKLVTIWDTPNTDYPFADTLAKVKAFVDTKQINGFANIAERNLGHIVTHKKMADGSLYEWHHFNAVVALQHYCSTARVSKIAEYNTNIEMFKRALETFKAENVETVLELISSNTLYRGSEFAGIIKAYQELARAYKNSVLIFSDYTVIAKASQAAARIRNTVIGTLIEDLNTFDLEAAVKRYEAKVAPTNYKRPTALITQGVVDSAVKTIKELGLESALERRYARLSDVSINDVLWANSTTSGAMKDGIEGLLQQAVKAPKAPDTSNIQEITVEDFLAHKIKDATAVDLLFENKHKGNLVSITAPVHPDSANIFKWDNPFAWSYTGDATDSFIAERVKQAGGNVNAKLRVSLAWHNADDLDLHCSTPDNKHISYGNKMGILDIDMNAYGKHSDTEPVENMQFTTIKDGEYKFVVHNFNRRRTTDVGFILEVASDLGVTQYKHQNAIKSDERVECLKITVKNGNVVSIDAAKALTSSSVAQEEWGVTTQQFVPVSAVTLSPNYWLGNEVGNKHFMFILEGCKNPDSVRGFYNEYLKPELDKHRKVFELLGNKTKAPYSDEQMSGLGFSSTKADGVVVRVTNSQGIRQYKITF